jgi:hypothetical protein
MLKKEIVGFYTIVAGEVDHANAPERVVKGMPRHPIPLLVPRATRRPYQSALGRTLQVADMIVSERWRRTRRTIERFKDDRAISFYRHFGFIPSTTDPAICS